MNDEKFIRVSKETFFIIKGKQKDLVSVTPPTLAEQFKLPLQTINLVLMCMTYEGYLKQLERRIEKIEEPPKLIVDEADQIKEVQHELLVLRKDFQNFQDVFHGTLKSLGAQLDSLYEHASSQKNSNGEEQSTENQASS